MPAHRRVSSHVHSDPLWDFHEQCLRPDDWGPWVPKGTSSIPLHWAFFSRRTFSLLLVLWVSWKITPSLQHPSLAEFHQLIFHLHWSFLIIHLAEFPLGRLNGKRAMHPSISNVLWDSGRASTLESNKSKERPSSATLQQHDIGWVTWSLWTSVSSFVKQIKRTPVAKGHGEDTATGLTCKLDPSNRRLPCPPLCLEYRLCLLFLS